MMIGLTCLVAVQAFAQAPKGGGTVSPYIDAKQQTSLWFGARSHWMQPWRAYQDTPPTSRLREALGINLNVDPDEADAVCRHLARNGFRKARIEIGWGSLSYDDPIKLADPGRFDKVVGACRKYGLRPLFLLNSHHGAPCPVRFFDVHLTQAAHKGDRTVKLAPGDVASIVPGRSGLNGLTDYWAAEALFTKVAPDGTATLSKPLPKDLPAGNAGAATLKFLPFYPSSLKADKSVPPEFTETINGWQQYIQTIGDNAKRVLGTEGKPDAGFDFECWNELTFGSNFLSINNYYEKPIADGDWAPDQILAHTVAYVADPAHGLPGAGVGNGFNNQWPWGAGSNAPPGLMALDKHPYAGAKRFPQDQGAPNGIRPVDALGQPDGVSLGTDKWQDTFIPTYVSDFPEYFLSAIQTEHLVRDISPITTDLYGVKHGRNTHPVYPDGKPAPAPQMWVTEVNFDVNGADPGDLKAYIAGGQKPVAPGITGPDADHIKAKAILRYLTSGVNKGIDRFYFFAAKDTNPLGLGLISTTFYAGLKANKNAYPADDAAVTSPTMLALRRLIAAMPDTATITHPRRLSLLKISDTHNHAQFEGDPATAAKTPNPHPPLYNREVVGFFPFQASDTRFVVPIYVMTRNLARLYKPTAAATDPTRFDLPDEHYRLAIAGLHPAKAKFALYDPMTGRTTTLRPLQMSATQTTFDLPLSDSPRLLLIND
jgi:hypothetical protein